MTPKRIYVQVQRHYVDGYACFVWLNVLTVFNEI